MFKESYDVESVESDGEGICEACGNPHWQCELIHCTGVTPVVDSYDPDPEDDA